MNRGQFLAASSAVATIGAALPPANVTLGDETFLRTTWRELGDRAVGVVTNQTGVTSDLTNVVDGIRRNGAIDVKAIFAPEHGLRGDRPAGAYVESYVDERSGLTVYSLYGATRKPSAEMLEGIDVVLYDIQDVGDRAYTYISTLAYVMQAAKSLAKAVWVLDRPNPIGGAVVEGPVLDPHFASFIGLYPLPIRHGMTVGELAQMFNAHFGIGANLRVVPMSGYTRDMFWPQTGLQWVQTSPNIPEWDTTLVYPATGLIDSAGINNGTNYSKPFKYAGTAGLDGYKLAAALNDRGLPGVHFRPASWSPFAGFWAGKTLTGVEVIVTSPRTFRAVRTAVEILVAIREQDPHAISISSAASLDRDWGTDTLRKALLAGLDADAILVQWEARTREFVALRERYLLY